MPSCWYPVWFLREMFPQYTSPRRKPANWNMSKFTTPVPNNPWGLMRGGMVIFGGFEGEIAWQV
jgi:hypothetical protein